MTVSREDIEIIERLADSMGFGRTHDTLRRALDALRCSQGVSAGELSDWSRLPRDVYVVSARSADGIVFDLQCCSVPMAIGPEVRYTATQGGSEVQDTYLVGGPPDLKAMSGSVESDRIIQLHFRRRATDEDRKWLLDAINEKIRSEQRSPPVSEDDLILVDCPRCGEGDQRGLGPNVCGLCECRFIVTAYGTKTDRTSLSPSTDRK